MKKLPTGTRVRAIRDIAPPVQDRAGRPFFVAAGEIGRIVAVGPDAAFGWYPIEFDANRTILIGVAPAQDAPTEVVG